MRLQVFVERRRLFVTDVEAGGVSTCVKHIEEMIPDRADVVLALDSLTHPNVIHIVRRPCRSEPRIRRP
jgi:hypothetical protein